MDYKKIIGRYSVYGVPQTSISHLMKELSLEEEEFYEFMDGQTCGLVGNIPIYYVSDIERFIRNRLYKP